MRVPRAVVDAMLDHGRKGYPFEVCGVFLAAPGTRDVVRAVPMLNREQEKPRVRYTIAPEDLVRVQREARAEGLDVIGYYHTHPDHPARPSETDRRIAAEGLSDGVVHVVIGVEQGIHATPTAWVFRDATQAFDEEPFEVV